MEKIISVPFSRIDPDQRMVYGYASTADRDSDGEIISLAALKEALPAYMKFASVREMHDAKPIGKTKTAEVDDRGLYIGAKIVDNDAWKMVKEEVYSAFSVGGKVLARDDEDPSVIKSMSLMEISLVDVPANPQCVIDLVKVADTSEDETIEQIEQDIEKIADELEAELEKKKKDDEDDDKDPDDDGDDDSEDSDDDDDKDEDRKEKAADIAQDDDEAAIIAREEALLYKRITERFGQAKADEVFGKVAEPEVEPESSFPSEDGNVESEQLEKALDGVEEELSKMEEGEFLATSLIEQLYVDFDIEKISALQATAKKEEVRKLLEFAKITKDITAKAGSRHSRADMDSLQAIHDHACKMGAECADKEATIKPGDLAKSYEKVRKLTSDLNAAQDTINKLNKQIADKENYIEKLKKTPAKPMPITAPAELPEGMLAIGKGDEKVEDDSNLNSEERAIKAWREARANAFKKMI